MKALILAVVAVVGFTASAQERGPMLDRLQTELGLSAEQMVKVEKIFTAQAEERRGMFEEAQQNGDRAAMREAMQAMQAETEKKLATVLTDEQMVKYREMAAQMRGGMPGRADRRGPGAGRPPPQE